MKDWIALASTVCVPSWLVAVSEVWFQPASNVTVNVGGVVDGERVGAVEVRLRVRDEPPGGIVDVGGVIEAVLSVRIVHVDPERAAVVEADLRQHVALRVVPGAEARPRLAVADVGDRIRGEIAGRAERRGGTGRRRLRRLRARAARPA
jgi:hypothetical protein